MREEPGREPQAYVRFEIAANRSQASEFASLVLGHCTDQRGVRTDDLTGRSVRHAEAGGHVVASQDNAWRLDRRCEPRSVRNKHIARRSHNAKLVRFTVNERITTSASDRQGRDPAKS